MTDHARTPPAPPAGTARLGIISTYFSFVGVAAAVATTGIAIAILVPHWGLRTIPSNPFVALAGAVSLTIGCFRARRLLDRRRKEGVTSAMIFLAAPLLGYFTGTPPSLLSLGATTGGLALLASVWRHLDW